ncbi:hypothetical protein NPIL_78491 [Nephila pilipes]|uniref:Uncharacterized protein n=1 Tax=Nephila pilipes TaxID=299642 RepID=A0A8X6Q704_NEPPI|nr:hypothetical protein NPIL_78491 [Nephila pilipes]
MSLIKDRENSRFRSIQVRPILEPHSKIAHFLCYCKSRQTPKDQMATYNISALTPIRNTIPYTRTFMCFKIAGKRNSLLLELTLQKPQSLPVFSTCQDVVGSRKREL